jgi:hypothetical protein
MKPSKLGTVRKAICPSLVDCYGLRASVIQR